MSSAAPTITAMRGGDKPAWAPGWAPTRATLDYLEKLATLLLLALGALYFLGLRDLKPFARRHLAEV